MVWHVEHIHIVLSHHVLKLGLQVADLAGVDAFVRLMLNSAHYCAAAPCATRCQLCMIAIAVAMCRMSSSVIAKCAQGLHRGCGCCRHHLSIAVGQWMTSGLHLRKMSLSVRKHSKLNFLISWLENRVETLRAKRLPVPVQSSWQLAGHGCGLSIGVDSST